MTTAVRPVTKLEARRRSAGLGRHKLAKASGVHYATILKAELHGQKPQYGTRLALATALGCKPEDLTGDA